MVVKRFTDVFVALPVTILSIPLVAVLVAIAAVSTSSSGLFRQRRVGRNGKYITIYKVRTMHSAASGENTVTVRNDPRITSSGSFMRRYKLDELPQFWSVLTGDMSLVGPRPDMPGFADQLVGDDRVVLELRPGITGPATLLFRGEEILLAAVTDPSSYNRHVVWPLKVRINKLYHVNRSVGVDLRCLLWTLVPNPQALANLLTSWDAGLLDDEVFSQMMELET